MKVEAKKVEPKKGAKSWAPAQMLSTVKPMSGHRLRWVDKDPANLDRKRNEGWVTASSLTGINATHEHPGKIDDGKPVTGIKEYRELVLMALPEDVAQAREAYFQERTKAQTVGLKHLAERENSANAVKHGVAAAPITGKITVIE